MKPVALTLSHFRGWKNSQRIGLNTPITSIIGENGRGKSSLANAIEWCLFGGEVEKKGSGIDERQDWELRTRVDKHDTEPTLVELEIETANGLVTVTRRREAGAKLRDPDLITIQTPDGCAHDGDAAHTWLAQSGLPDWETYRRAYCFHQEAARQRVVNSKERDSVLAALLGLDDDLLLREAIESQKPSSLLREIDELLENLEAEAHRALELPQQRLRELETQLIDSGVDRAQFLQSSADSLRAQLVTRGTDLAELLGQEVVMPDVSDADGVRTWAKSWPSQARASAPVLAPLDELRASSAKLSALIADFRQFDGAWRKARGEIDELIKSGGDQSQRENAVTQAEGRLNEANAALEKNNARAKLLVDARKAILATGGKEECPVCDTPVAGLATRLEAEADQLRSAEFRKLEAEQTEARAELDAARSARESLAGVVKAEGRAKNARSEKQEDLRKALTEEVAEEDQDSLAAANKQLELLAKEIARLESIVSRRDEALQAHQSASNQLDLLERWLDASTKAEESIDLSALTVWQEFDRSIDDLAGFASDLDALAGIARDVQAERSEVRAEEVNQALGKYYSLINCREDVRDIRVTVRQTAQRIQYNLVDATGRPAVPILNQAAINALSLAMLLAQAEAAAGADSWEMVILDDPIQSLDRDRQKGLAAAIEAMTDHCSVLVATVPGPFTERLTDYVSTNRCFVELGPWSSADGASIASEETR